MNKNELISLLRSSKTIQDIDAKREEIAEYIPQVRTMFDYDLKTPKQPYDLWTHSLKTVVNLQRDMEDELANNMLYLAALLHDIGKPDCQSVKTLKNGKQETVYDGHDARSVEILEQQIFPELEAKGDTFTEEEKNCLKYYIQYHHDMPGRMKRYVRKHMMLVSCDQFVNLMHLGIADCHAQAMYNATKDRVRINEYLIRKSDDGFVTVFLPTKWFI